MRLEGLAPTYSVASALGESDSIKNQRVSTKFSRRLLPTSTFSMPGLALLVLWPLKILAPENMYFDGKVQEQQSVGEINYSEEVGFSGSTSTEEDHQLAL